MVLHLGALIPIPYSFKHAREYVSANIEGTLNVLEASRRSDVRRIVQVSSSEVYGTAQVVPIPESHPLHPQSPYAATKVGADQLALTYWHAHRPAGRARPPVQHLRAAPVGPGRDPDRDHPGPRARPDRARRDEHDARLPLRRGHGARPRPLRRGRRHRGRDLQPRDRARVLDRRRRDPDPRRSSASSCLSSRSTRASARAAARSSASCATPPARTRFSAGSTRSTSTRVSRGRSTGCGPTSIRSSRPLQRVDERPSPHPGGSTLADVSISDEDRRAVMEVLDSGWLSMGPVTARFEDDLAAFLRTRARARRDERHCRAASRRGGARPRPG